MKPCHYCKTEARVRFEMHHAHEFDDPDLIAPQQVWNLERVRYLLQKINFDIPRNKVHYPQDHLYPWILLGCRVPGCSSPDKQCERCQVWERIIEGITEESGPEWLQEEHYAAEQRYDFEMEARAMEEEEEDFWRAQNFDPVDGY